MKTRHIINTLVTVLQALMGAIAVQAQGTVTFDYPWATGGVGYYSLYYDNSGMSFCVNPYPPQPHDDMARIGAIQAGHPNNGTPHAEFSNTLGISQSVVFSLTNAASFGHLFNNGAPFGLTSVDLADPVAPSLSPVSITFNAFKGDGSMVSETFTVGGGGTSTFQTYNFNTDFANGLVRVEIPSAAWAVDNIAWVPEPGVVSLLCTGLLIFAVRVIHRRHKTGGPPAT